MRHVDPLAPYSQSTAYTNTLNRASSRSNQVLGVRELIIPFSDIFTESDLPNSTSRYYTGAMTFSIEIEREADGRCIQIVSRTAKQVLNLGFCVRRPRRNPLSIA